ncbi:hypothetical protein PO909_034118, partial [Leuciscus waleckii]
MSLCDEREEEDAVQTQTAASPGSSCVSMKSNSSMIKPPFFSDGVGTSKYRHHIQSAASPVSSCVSMKSNSSMIKPPFFSDGAGASNSSSTAAADMLCAAGCERKPRAVKSCMTCDAFYSQTHIRQHYTEPALHTLVLETGDLEQDLHQLVDDILQRVKEKHKTSMKRKYESLFEGIKLQENETLLNRIYTQFYIIEGEREGVNEEHEVLQIEKTARTQHLQDTPICCNDIFKASPESGCEEKDQIKTVLTKGI